MVSHHIRFQLQNRTSDGGFIQDLPDKLTDWPLTPASQEAKVNASLTVKDGRRPHHDRPRIPSTFP